MEDVVTVEVKTEGAVPAEQTPAGAQSPLSRHEGRCAASA
jgi:hypothetical protein